MSFKPYIQDIKQILQQPRQKTYSAINAAMVDAYWQIGRRIVEEEQQGEKRAAYGEGLLKELALALTEEFGKGFSAPNLRNFRQFYLTYPDKDICYTLCSKLSWSHNRLIMRVENEKARAFYLAEAAAGAWSVRVLERNINTLYYERLLSSPDKKELPQITELEKQSPRDFIKDPYIFEFLNIPQSHRISEADLEGALIDNLQQFLLELGKGFSFVGRQFRISTETKHFFIDLVFYNYLLKCFVLIDLKIGELTHQDTGQMDMYIRLFDDLKLSEGDNPTIGVILCSEKDETIVKYSIPKENRQLFASKYRLYLPTEDELVAEIEREKLLLKEKFREDGQ
jgi:predicted nuclease of restriction endonuclease-like (RecB) superfamily